MAAAEQGRKILVRAGTTFEVSDHDFTRFSIVPSVTIFIYIPERIEEPWYRGQVYVGYKDIAFEPLSDLRHAKELSNLLISLEIDDKSVLFCIVMVEPTID